MSDPITKARRSKVKDARQSPAPDVPVHGPPGPKKKKPVDIQWQTLSPKGYQKRFFPHGDRWGRWKSYPTREKALQALPGLQRKYSRLEWVFRIAGEEK